MKQTIELKTNILIAIVCAVAIVFAAVGFGIGRATAPKNDVNDIVKKMQEEDDAFFNGSKIKNSPARGF